MNWFIDRSSNTPPYQQLLSQIKEQIRGGTLKENDPLPSVREMAERLDTSLTTVQKVFSELKREGLIYARSGKGVFIAKKQNKFANRIIVFIPSAELSFYAEILKGIYSTANSASFEVQVHSLDSPIAWNERTSELLDRAMDSEAGVIFVEEPFGDLRKKCQLAAKSIPFVTVEWEMKDAVSIVNDYEKSSCEAIEHLLFYKKAKSILVLKGRDFQFNSQKKLAGVEAAIKKHKGTHDFQIQFLESDFYPHSGYLAVKSFLEKKPIDAVFCSNDWEASGVIGALGERGLLVGKDVALVGYGNYTEKLTSYFPLSTVDQNLTRLGEAAAEAIIRRMRGQKVEKAIVVETRLIVRKT